MTVAVGDGVEACSTRRAWANTFLSFVGAGILGLPYAFKKTGLAASAIVLCAVGILSAYCMLILVECKRRINGKGGKYARVDTEDVGDAIIPDADDGDDDNMEQYAQPPSSEIVKSYGEVAAHAQHRNLLAVFVEVQTVETPVFPKLINVFFGIVN